MANQPREFNETLAIGLILALVAFCGGVLWIVASQYLGPVYRVFRLIETAGLWHLTGWGQYFASVPRGGQYEFWSLFLSSVPFGAFCAILVVLLGWHAHDKVKSQHIDNYTSHDGPLDYRDVMQKQAVLFPHNAFFLHFDMNKYPQDHGAAGMPMTAQEFLRSVKAVRFEQDVPKFDLDKIRTGLIARFGPENGLRECFARTGSTYVLAAGPDQIARHLEKLRWFEVLVLYGALARTTAMAGASEKGFLVAVKRVDEFMRDIWRDIMIAVEAEKKREVVLSLGIETAKPAIALADFLSECADDFPTVKAARAALEMLIVGEAPADQVAELDKKVPVILGAQKDVHAILARHGFVSGVLADALLTTRRAGIFPPNVFLWLRFVDQDLWRFLIYVGMATPCAEASGVFEHFRAELALGQALAEPFLDDAPLAIIRESRNYVFDPEEDPRISAADETSLIDKTRSMGDTGNAVEATLGVGVAT